MADPEQRERESRESDVTKFEEEVEAESEERDEAAEGDLPEPTEDES